MVAKGIERDRPAWSRRESESRKGRPCKAERQTKSGLIGILLQCFGRFWNEP
jgi:hypothetical protein